MRVLHVCMLGVTFLLLVCEVTISQLCKSLITLVDGFHTLFILLRMAIPPPPPTASRKKPLLFSLDSSASLPHNSTFALHAESSVESLPGTGADGSLDCGVTFSSSRVQPVGAFISALLLTSLCLSFFMEIVSFSLKPHPVERPLLLVVVSAVSLLHKMLLVWLNWDRLQDETVKQASAAEETKGLAELGRVLADVSQIQSAVDDSLHNGVLVLCNPGTSSIPDTDSQTTQQRPEVHLHAAAQQDTRGCGADLKVCKSESCSEDITELSKDNTCMGHVDCQITSDTPACTSSYQIERTVASSHWPVSLLLFILIIQGICTSLLALINSLVMLLIDPQFLHSSGACGLLLYLDAGLSLLALIMLIATAAPQVLRYGLLLLEAIPPHICVSDLGRRITSVPGVQAVHDLHIWQLTESFIVASVHVHCHAGFPPHRWADLMSGVTKVLQSVGVSCCTVQPEFSSCSEPSAGSEVDASPVVHRGDPSLPPLLTCSLACGNACAEDMCCSPLEVETCSLPAPPGGETKEEPQTLVIENTFL